MQSAQTDSVKDSDTWNNEDDQQLIDAITIQGLEWKQLQETLPGKNEFQCIYRLQMLQNKWLDQWTEKEDELLKELIIQYKENWDQIAYFMKNKTKNQIKIRFFNLNNTLDNKPWKQEEDDQLHQLIHKYGTQWNQIAEQMKDRSDYEIKYRYYSLNKQTEHKMMLNLKKIDSESEKQEELEIKTFKTEIECKQELSNIEPQPKKKVNIEQYDQQQNHDNVSYLCPRNFIFQFEQLFECSSNEPKKIVWIPVPIIRIKKKTPVLEQTDNQLEQSIDELKQEEESKTQKN